MAMAMLMAMTMLMAMAMQWNRFLAFDFFILDSFIPYDRNWRFSLSDFSDILAIIKFLSIMKLDISTA